jgi:hypothetical protein
VQFKVFSLNWILIFFFSIRNWILMLKPILH